MNRWTHPTLTRRGTGSYVSGRKSHSEVRGRQNNGSRRTISRETLGAFDIDDTLTQSFDDAPPTQAGSQGNSYRTDQANPEGYISRRIDFLCRNEG